jgi:hypothetical protein
MLTTTIALLAAFSAPVQGGPDLSGHAPVRLMQPVLLMPVDSAHTLFTPNAPDPGRAGQIYQLPQGGMGVTTGGTSHYQTLEMPGSGSAVAVPNGNSTATVFGSGGRLGTSSVPD